MVAKIEEELGDRLRELIKLIMVTLKMTSHLFKIKTVDPFAQIEEGSTILSNSKWLKIEMAQIQMSALQVYLTEVEQLLNNQVLRCNLI